jgi:hypothetical protein
MTHLPVSDEFRLVVRVERLRVPGLVDTLTSQVPEVSRALEVMAQKAFEEVQDMGKEGWRLVSHSVAFTAGLAILTLTLARTRF